MPPDTPTPTPRPLMRRADGLSVRAAAETAGVHEQTIRNWIHQGHLPVTRFGLGPKPVIRIHSDDLANCTRGR